MKKQEVNNVSIWKMRYWALCILIKAKDWRGVRVSIIEWIKRSFQEKE